MPKMKAEPSEWHYEAEPCNEKGNVGSESCQYSSHVPCHCQGLTSKPINPRFEKPFQELETLERGGEINGLFFVEISIQIFGIGSV